MKLLKVNCFSFVVLLLCLSVKGLSLSESYSNFANGNGVNENTDSAESSYETLDETSNEVQKIDPSRSIPAHSTYFVTATRYDHPYHRSAEREHVQDPSRTGFLENPSFFSSKPQLMTDDSQPDFSPEDLDPLMSGNSPLMSGDSMETTTIPMKTDPVTDDIDHTNASALTDHITMGPDQTNAAPIIATKANNELDIDDSLINITTTAPDEEQAELFVEPIPTPMALISSNGEGSNPPLEEEFAEAFKKFGPNGRRRRIRPGGVRRRVRMRVKKLIGERSVEIDPVSTYSNLEHAASEPRLKRRPRRYRSTTPSPDVNGPTLPQPTMFTTVVKNGPKPIIISSIHSGSTGLNTVPQEPQLEKPGSGGFTEKISTYFFTPPSRISTTVEPKIKNDSRDVADVENQLHSSSSYSLKTHLWDTAAEPKSNDITETTPLPTKNEPEKSESVRKTIQTPMEDRAFSVHTDGNPDLDYDTGLSGRNSFTREHHEEDKFRNPFGDNGGTRNNEDAFLSNPPPYNHFETNTPSPQANTADHNNQRSHYDRTKDPFFKTNQFFKTANPFPTSSEQGSSSSVLGNIYHHHHHEGIPPTGPGPETESSQMQLPLFDQNGEYVSTMSPMAEPFYAQPHPEDQPLNDLSNDYGSNTHYTPSEFKGSPVDPVQKDPLRRGTFTQLQQPSFPNDYNYDNSPSSGGLSSSSLPQGDPYTVNDDAYPGSIAENTIQSTPDAYIKSDTALSLQYPQTNRNEQMSQGNHNNEFSHIYDHEHRPGSNGLNSNFTSDDAEYNNNDIFHAVPPPSYDVPLNISPSEGPPPGYPMYSQSSPGGDPLRYHSNRPMGPPPMMHRQPPNHFFRNSAPPPPLLNHPMYRNRFSQRLPLPNTPLYTIAHPSGSYEGGPILGRSPADFHNSSPHVNLPMPGLSNIPPPPSEQQALNEVMPHHHFPPHTHSMSDKPDYEPANPPLPHGHPMELNYPQSQYIEEVSNNHHDHPQQGHTHSNYQDQRSQQNFDEPEPPPHSQISSPYSDLSNHHPHHQNEEISARPGHQSLPGYDIVSAYYDKPPPTVGSEYDHVPISNNDLSKVPFQYSSSDGGGLDNAPYLPNLNSDAKQNSQKENNHEPFDSSDTQSKDKGNTNNEEKNITAMYSETPYVLMFPQLVPEAAMIPPPPKILNKEVPVVQASSLSTMKFTPEGKPVLGPGLKAVAVHPRHQMYQVLAKAHYDKALQKYIEARKKPPSAIYTPYGILVPMGPSATASTNNHEKYAKLESHQGKAHYPKDDPHERKLLHLLLGKKSPLGHFHLFKSASIKNGRLKKQFNFKANIDPALDLLAEKLAIKLSTAKYILTAPAKLGVKAFSKQTTSYSQNSPVIESPPGEGGRIFANSLALGSDLKDILAGSQSNYANTQVKGEEIDPELKKEIKNMLKDRLKEILEEPETGDMEKEHLAALASNLINNQVQFSGTSSNPNNKQWSSYFPQTNGGLIGTIRRIFFGNPSSNGSDRSDMDSISGGHPFGGGSLSYSNTVGRMGLPGSEPSSPSSRSEAKDAFRRSGVPLGSQKNVKKQLEKWLDMVLKTSDMSPSESNSHHMFTKYPSGTKVVTKKLGKSDSILFPSYKPEAGKKSSLASLSLSNSLNLNNLSHKLSSSSFVPSNFLSSSWTPIVSSALRSVFNYSPSKSETEMYQKAT